MKKFDITFGIIKIPLDFLLTLGAIIVAYKLRITLAPYTNEIKEGTLPTLNEQFFFGIKSACLLIFIFALGKFYSLKKTEKLSKEIYKITTLWFIWVMGIISYYFYVRNFPFSRLALLYGWLITLLFLTFGHYFLYKIQIYVQRLGVGKSNLIFIGSNKITEELFEIYKKNPSYNILGVVGYKNSKLKLHYLGGIKQLEYILKKKKIEEIIQTKPLTNEKDNEEILRLCDLHHIIYRFVPNLMEVRQANIEIETINTYPIISLKPTPLDGWGKVIKRIFDIIGSLIGLIILSPILLLTAIAIKIDSKGPILFSKLDEGSPVKRIGRHGKAFRFYKFRSMYPNTHNLRYTELAEKNIRNDGPLVKIKDDPRITKVGKFIRKTSIDELPNLWSVLIGDMSLVGPRPHLPEEVKKYEDKHKFVLTIKPGITGISQTSGRSDLPFEEEIRLDRYYIENWSILFDIKILIKTLIIIIKPFKE